MYPLAVHTEMHYLAAYGGGGGGGGRGNSPIKMTGVLVGNVEKNPKKVPESRLVGVAQINFHP